MTAKESGGWFERRLSIGNIITIAVVLAGVMAGWFEFDNRLTAIEKDVATNRMLAEAEASRLGLRVTAMETQRQDLTTRVIRIEERLTSQSEKIDRILRSVERTDWRRN